MHSKRTVYKFSQAKNHDIELLNEAERELIDIANSHFHIFDGFIISSTAYLKFLEENFLIIKINGLLSTVHIGRVDSLMQVSGHIKKLILDSKMPSDVEMEIRSEYKKLGNLFKKAVVHIGESNHSIKTEGELTRGIIEFWASQFGPQHLSDFYKNKKAITEKIKPVIIKKHIDYTKKGKLFTSDNSFSTDSRLSTKEKNMIQAVSKKLKIHFYFPKIAGWGIKDKKVYIIDIKPMTNVKTSYLVLIRHGRSEYNEKGVWAGWDEPPLTKNGKEDVRIAAETIKDIHLDIGYTSHLIRHTQTLDVIKKILNRHDLPVVIDDSLLERNYGDFTAKNKWEMEKQLGKEEFLKLRRSWDYSIPNGESLKQVYERVIPCYKNVLLPQLKSGKNIIIASSGNALRALVKYLENISDDDISKLEIATGEVYVYKIDEDGKVVGKEIRNQHENIV